MNKTIKVISALLIAVMLMVTLSQTCFAASGIISDLDGAGYSSSEMSGVQGTAKKILSAIRNVAVIAAVIVISYLGIKYMIGSTEEKASYKKAFMPLIVGVILVVAAAQIATMLFSIGSTTVG